MSMRKIKLALHRSRAMTIALLLAVVLSPLLISAEPAPTSEEPTVLITGSNRGLGLALARVYAEKGWRVIATCRDPERATDLNALAARHPTLTIDELDVTDEAEIAKLAAKYAGRPIDVVINNAGILGPVEHKSVDQLDYDKMAEVLEVNVMGPLKVSAAFADSVALSRQKKIFAVTTGFGSLTLMGYLRGFYYYRISKAALDMAMRALNAEFRQRGITVGLISPGMVDTDLLAESGYSGKSLTPEESAAALYDLIDRYTPEMTQAIYNYDGQQVPW